MNPQQAATFAAQVLAKANFSDPRFRHGDAGMTAVWAEAIAKYELDIRYLLDAVAIYYEESRDRVIQIGDVLKIARDLRQRDAMVDNAQSLASPVLVEALPRGSGASTHMGVVNAVGEPIGAAYEVDGAGHIPCPSCRAQPGASCGRGGHEYRIPCAARLAAAHRNRKRN